MTALPVLAGAALALGGWAAARAAARSPPRAGPALAVDLSAPLLLWLLLSLALLRPLSAGLAVGALLAGLAVADHFKREVLREPVVFCDSAELIELVRHPGLYLPFVGPVRVLLGMAAVAAALALALVLEPPAFAWPAGARWACAAAAPLLVLAVMGPLLPAAAATARALRPTGDPKADASRLGPLATLFAYGLIARAERPAIRAALRARVAAAASSPRAARGHLVLIQAESFLDPRRLGLGAPPDLMPVFDRLAPLSTAGLMEAPTWGASTIRTEFEVLTGADAASLGYDRFNPYYALTRERLPSLAWRLRERGYRTACLHPFDRRFYGRDRVLAQLGFEMFEGAEAFAPAPPGRYVSDAALADRAEQLLRASERPTFLFLITMENHGPWAPVGAGERPPGLTAYLDGVRAADALLGRMVEATAPLGGSVAFYGDHGPMLDGLGAESRTDFLLHAPGRPAARRDIRASELGELWLDLFDRGETGRQTAPAWAAGPGGGAA